MQKSGFFTSVNGDRKEGADWLAKFTAGIISNGVYTTELTTTGGNGDMSVTVGMGRAWINGYLYSNDAALKLAIGTADGSLSRTDLVVLRLDMTNRQITLAIVQGTFGSSVPAITRTADIYELELAEVAVAAGTTAITQAMITDKRADETVCGIVAGAVTQLSTGELLEQLKAGFDTWFDAIKGQLSTDAAGNLQNEIDEKADKDKMFYPNNQYGGIIVTDFNAISVSGFYTGTGAATGAPNTSSSWFVLHTNSNAGTTAAWQLARSYSDGTTYIRQKMNSAWGAWAKFDAQQLGVSSATAAKYFSSPSGSETVDEILGKLGASLLKSGSSIVDALGSLVTLPSAQLDSRVQFATSSYTGTGTYGYLNPNSIVASFEIKIAVVRAVSSSSPDPVGLFVFPKKSGALGDSSESWYATNSSDQKLVYWASSDGKTLYWYCGQGTYSQLNNSGHLYEVLMIGW